MNEVLALFIIVLLLIVLLLTIGILTIFLWCALLLLRSLPEYLGKQEKTKEGIKEKEFAAKENRRTEENPGKVSLEKVKENIVLEPPLHYEEKAVIGGEDQKPDIFDRQLKNIAESTVVEKNEAEYKEAALMKYITGEEDSDLMRISVVNPDEKGNYDFIARFTEKEGGKLAVFREEKDVLLVIPIRSVVDYKDFSYGDIGNAYIFNKEIEPSKQYKIVGVEKICKMERNLEYFTILEKGSLRIEEIHF